MAADADLREQLDAAQARIRSLEAEIELAREHAHDSEGQIAAARRNFAKLEEELRTAAAHADDLEAQLVRAARNADDSHRQLEAARAHFAVLEKQLEEAREGQLDLEAQLVGARRERERLSERVEVWRAKALERRSPWHALLRRRPASPLPRHLRATRDRISRRMLGGDGIEIGALHSPVRVRAGTRVRYVDRLSTEALRREYPEQAEHDFVHVDLIDEGEVLGRIESGSVDFIVANHMLEHCENPLGTLRNHLDKLRPGGLLYYIVPDRRGGFDANRPLTSFDHLVDDDADGGEGSRLDHYLEYAEHVEKAQGREIEIVARDMLAARSNIHFHVWEDSSFREFLERAASHLGVGLRIVHFELSHTEVIAVVCKDDPAEAAAKHG